MAERPSSSPDVHGFAAADRSKEQQQRNTNLVRIRDNQRRSRARRKEYLEALEFKLRKCQQLGIEASAEIQAAARRVLDENRRLRQLLQRHGLSDAEIDGLIVNSPIDNSPQYPNPDHNGSATTEELAGMLSTRRACICEDEPASSCSQISNSTNTPSLLPTATTTTPFLASQPAISPLNASQPRLLQPRPPVPVSFQHLSTQSPRGSASHDQSNSGGAVPFHPAHMSELPGAPHPPPLASQPNIAFHPLDPTYDLNFDDSSDWLLNFSPLPETAVPSQRQSSPASSLAVPSAIAGSHLIAPSSLPSATTTASMSASMTPTSPAFLADTSSCLAAADLIRTIKPDIELAELERELGCADGGECKLPLTHIFRVMDHVAAREE